MEEVDESRIIGVIRSIMRRRRIKLSDLAKDLDLPYGTLQNYMYGRSKIPLSLYIQICAELSIPMDYPVHERFKLSLGPLREALLHVLSSSISKMHLTEDMDIVSTDEENTDRSEVRRIAVTIAHLIESHYDYLIEQDLWAPPDDAEGEEN